MSQLQKREDIDDQYKWNPEDVFQTESEWEQAADRVQSRLNDLRTEDITRSSEDLVETLDEFFDLTTEFERVEVYVSLRAWIDTTDERAQELSGRVDDLRSKLQTARSIIETNVKQTSADRIETMLAESEALSQYDHYLRNLIRQAGHTADPAVEEAVSTLAPALGGHQTYGTLLNADLSFGTV